MRAYIKGAEGIKGQHGTILDMMQDAETGEFGYKVQLDSGEIDFVAPELVTYARERKNNPTKAPSLDPFTIDMANRGKRRMLNPTKAPSLDPFTIDMANRGKRRMLNPTEDGFEVTKNEIRYRVLPPKFFNRKTFRYIEIGTPYDGIRAVSARLLSKHDPYKYKQARKEQGKPRSMVLQSFRFDRQKGWDITKARAWIKAHMDEILRVVQDRVKNPRGHLYSSDTVPSDAGRHIYYHDINPNKSDLLTFASGQEIYWSRQKGRYGYMKKDGTLLGKNFDEAAEKLGVDNIDIKEAKAFFRDAGRIAIGEEETSGTDYDAGLFTQAVSYLHSKVNNITKARMNEALAFVQGEMESKGYITQADLFVLEQIVSGKKKIQPAPTPVEIEVSEDPAALLAEVVTVAEEADLPPELVPEAAEAALEIVQDGQAESIEEAAALGVGQTVLASGGPSPEALDFFVSVPPGNPLTKEEKEILPELIELGWAEWSTREIKGEVLMTHRTTPEGKRHYQAITGNPPPKWGSNRKDKKSALPKIPKAHIIEAEFHNLAQQFFTDLDRPYDDEILELIDNSSDREQMALYLQTAHPDWADVIEEAMEEDDAGADIIPLESSPASWDTIKLMEAFTDHLNPPSPAVQAAMVARLEDNIGAHWEGSPEQAFQLLLSLLGNKHIRKHDPLFNLISGTSYQAAINAQADALRAALEEGAPAGMPIPAADTLADVWADAWIDLAKEQMIRHFKKSKQPLPSLDVVFGLAIAPLTAKIYNQYHRDRDTPASRLARLGEVSRQVGQVVAFKGKRKPYVITRIFAPYGGEDATLELFPLSGKRRGPDPMFLARDQEVRLLDERTKFSGQWGHELFEKYLKYMPQAIEKTEAYYDASFDEIEPEADDLGLDLSPEDYLENEPFFVMRERRESTSIPQDRSAMVAQVSKDLLGLASSDPDGLKGIVLAFMKQKK